MNKKQPGKYRLTVYWNGREHEEWYTDKSRAIARKEELSNYRDADSPDSSPFTNIKIEFVPEDKIPVRRW